jgi:TonB-linked SusC/RagA family outer membrane protein
MKLTTLILFLFLAGIKVAVSAPQEQAVTGIVTDAVTSEPLPGVNVLIEGTQTGVSTDLYGKYSLPKPSNSAIIAFSFVGYTTERITYSGQSVIDVKLSQVVRTLDEIVVIGYGTQKKSDLTGAISTVKAKDIEKSTPLSVDLALQGRVPGLVVTSNSGDPGNYGTTVTIRGIGTVNNNSPIYVVDGMIVDVSDKSNRASNINFLNPSDIESIEVLKDASAQAIYGSRGANGVILITTRKGTDGAPKVTFNSTFGYENLIRINKVLDATEYRDFVVGTNYNDYIRYTPNADPNTDPYTLTASQPVIDEYNKGFNTDWMHEILRDDRMSQNYDLSLTGGTRDFHYAASAGYLDKKGLIKLSEYKRYAFRLNSDYKVSRYVTLGENLGITSSNQSGDWYLTSIMSSALRETPLTAVLKPEGSVDPADPNYRYNKYAPTMSGGANPVMQTELQNYPISYQTFLGNIFGEVTLLKDLKFRSSWGFNIAGHDQSHFDPVYYLPSLSNTVSTLGEKYYRSNGWVWENTLTWNKKIKDHLITALVGYTSEYTKYKYTEVSKKGTPTNDPEMQTFDAATTEATVTGGYNTFSMMSYFGRINYSFLDKYLLTATVRRDGSSKFGPGHKWGTFPSFSLGWKINEEGFFKGFAGDFFSNLKLRAGWGEIGNSSLPVYNAYVSQIMSNPPGDDLRYIFNETVNQGYWLSTIGTPDITWETTGQTNVGIDIAILKNSLSISADYYIKNTRNMLLQLPVPIYAGYPPSAAPYTNAGSVQNKGFEIIINYQGKAGNFTYGASVNGATFSNVVTSLGAGNLPIISNYGTGTSRTEVGSSIGRYYGYVTNGVFQTEDEVQTYKDPDDNVIQPNAHAGDFRFKDLNNDGIIDGQDETWIGSPWPKLTYGFNLNLGYKAFDIVLFFQGSYGNDIYNWGRWYGNTLFQNVFEYYYKNAWSGPGTSDSQPILTSVDQNGNYYKSSGYYVEDGSYLRLKNLQLGYNLPKTACEKLKITYARLWVGGTNLLTFTKYHGNDPEVGATSSPTLDAGLDTSGYYPRPSEITMGLTVTF